MACENGINAIIGDGVHKLNPKTAPVHMEKGQLYTIHASCNGEMEVPILYAITRSKKQATYRTIFGALKEVLNRHGAPERLRIILDYEKAAVKAAKATFPESVVQGCAFHLAQAWNGKSKEKGLRQYIVGKKRAPVVIRWWRIIKGVVFLPTTLLHRLNALRRPPVNARHPAYRPSKNFLDYLQKTWLHGPFKDMWCKWDLHELRTTNSAEAFHRYFLHV
ncbi:hypothetical protein ANCDUO_01580 [Ancylostoma duodenale]|uniref:MULE transposase domain-containing protein n=1 Tax=Ancylostoma duodenale TaxID=51022 RepID=A0A0C2DYJ1_9BILA|nr:hypothetical protein ANCDUO_01580 [Ancylostoma duodenale]